MSSKVTTIIELVGLGMLNAAAGLWGGLAVGLATGGVSMFVASWRLVNR